ncbi:MAG: adenylosuccinate lyase [Spirochaetaceae bacterium]|jgi:adenylosuccinate lyase|nr:adenylosuccinate lyase [Spirochaetaceae bacterium]
MMMRSVFSNISPLDHRYSISEQDVFDALVPYLSEDAALRACAQAEIALVKAHLSLRKRRTPQLDAALNSSLERFKPEAVYAEEEKTRHSMRALVNVLKTLVPPEAAPLVHLGATSADILDSALAWRIKEASSTVVMPLLRRLEALLCDITEREAATPQVGRTHGQHAVPITVGFAFAGYTARLGKSILELEQRICALKGKLSGAVGAYNATSMITPDPEGLEQAYLAELGLEPSEYSTQLVEPEYLLRLLLEMTTAFGIIANLADDLRNLQRSEIGELKEGFDDAQVGSSTMPQKRNPWNSEHVKSLWKAYMPRVTTFFLDQISEHQRDLTNSASQRFVAEYITGFACAARRMILIVEGLSFNRERLRANLAGGSIEGGILAEPAYILLAESGVNDAHEVVRRVTLRAEEQHLSFAQALSEEQEALAAIEQTMRRLNLLSSDECALDFFQKPERYQGRAVEKARAMARKYRAKAPK